MAEIKNKPELVCPVRDEVSFTAALDAGADSMYMGLGSLNMRTNSKGIDCKDLPLIVSEAHSAGSKIYATLNAIIYDDDLDMLAELVQEVVDAGVDAVICSDFAVIELLKRQYPDMPIHLSTQANVSNSRAAEFFKGLGVKRIVLARELNLLQIKEIKQKVDVEIETFVHGAMCLSVSGRCYMSQFLFNASANRGECHQPCRRKYDVYDDDINTDKTKDYEIIDRVKGSALHVGDGYVMSPKDICALPLIDRLIDAGIDSFKIEGRSRSPEYIKTVTAAYRKAIDAAVVGKFNDGLVKELMSELTRVYNRGFSRGFYLGMPGAEDMSEVEGSAATERKLYAGRVLNYFSKKRIAHVNIEATSIYVGSKIQIHGSTTGVVQLTVTEMLDTEGRSVASVNTGEVTFVCPEKVRENDKVYIIEASGG